MNHKVLITTSGIGSRLGPLTAYTNKSLVRIGTKPAISHIIEEYPKDTRFVVTIGHFGKQVRDFLSLTYPQGHFEYVEVKNYDGPGSSLGLSMLDAKSALQCPFIFHACDTLIDGPVPMPDKNWIGVYKGSDTTQYASWVLRDGKLQFNEKGAINADFLHIGLVGIHDFASFWDELGKLYASNPDNKTLNDCQTLSKMIEKGVPMELTEFPVWHDIGNPTALQAARRDAGSSLDDLDKAGEAVFMFDTFVIKFFSDEKIVRDRAERGKMLKGFVPDMEGVVGNFYRYKLVPGELYSHIVQPTDFKKFLEWAQNSFWREENEAKEDVFREACRSFYVDKTNRRIDQFLKANDLKDTDHVINGEQIPALREVLKLVDFARLFEGLQSRFHGDFILDNILKTDYGYCLLDWRQDFGGLLRGGDRYYDLAKLNHNLTVNHGVINNNLFTVESDGRNVRVEIMRSSSLVDCQVTFFDFIRKYKYDTRKIRQLTALIWLNMAPLHHYPFNHFLYYYGKLNLWRSLKENDVLRKL
ncbi:hypothetical protein KW800_02895 [Candidatus Parcubacteria bacterium]|nr:hypothetical protein [Candidatus Parcubacteria bacterium]